MLTLPNILTLSRIFAIPLLAYFLWWPGWAAGYLLAFGLYCLMGITDYFDGYVARARGTVSRLGAFLDPIADKIMIAAVILLLVFTRDITGVHVIAALVILLREIIVSGLREFLGDVAGTLKVTKLAKWKTAVQMIAIALLLAQGGLNTTLGMAVFGMDAPMITAILDGSEEDPLGIRGMLVRAEWAGYIGLILIWLAAGLTAITGWDYFSKARAHLGED